jgi:flavin-dependent dehydrogenase
MYDAIVVGARCAGAPTAMLLARKGYRVLMLDRDAFPSDIMSTHFIQLPGVIRLHRWGLYDQVLATGAPKIEQATLHLGETAMSPPRPPVPEGFPDRTICPRRYLLDKILIDAAIAAGAEFREACPVRELTWHGDTVTGVRARAKSGGEFTESARIVIGADGMYSIVAKHVSPDEYDVVDTLSYGYYTYWEDVRVPGAELYFFDDIKGLLAFPTNDNKTCIGVGGAREGFHEFRTDIEGNYMKIIDRVPSIAEQVHRSPGRERFLGTADQPNYFRKPYGPGWALVGDAGYHRDFLTGLGINDAFLHSEFLVEAIDAGFSGARPLDEALAAYEAKRNEFARPAYNFTIKLARGSLPEMQDLLAFGASMQRALTI